MLGRTRFGMASIVERHRDKVRGVISCFDRVILQGTLPGFCHANGMTSYLYAQNIRIFDYPRFAEPLRNEIRENAEKLARENGVEIEFVGKASFRKEERVQEILAQRGHHPGLVCILSAMESCTSYRPWPVKADDIATFLGRKLTKNYPDELGNNFGIRIEGTRIKHRMGSASIKMYDKCGLVLRIETTANDVSFFKHHRKVEQRDGTTVYKLAPLKKSIYSLGDLRGLMLAANRRYLEFVSKLDDPTVATRNLEKIAATIIQDGRTYKGFNFFDHVDTRLFEALVRGENNITGLRNKDLQQQLPELSSGVISRALERLRVHGLVKRVGHTYKYYVTSLGCAAITAGLMLKEFFLVPALDTASIF